MLDGFVHGNARGQLPTSSGIPEAAVPDPNADGAIRQYVGARTLSYCDLRRERIEFHKRAGSLEKRFESCQVSK